MWLVRGAKRISAALRPDFLGAAGSVIASSAVSTFGDPYPATTEEEIEALKPTKRVLGYAHLCVRRIIGSVSIRSSSTVDGVSAVRSDHSSVLALLM